MVQPKAPRKWPKGWIISGSVLLALGLGTQLFEEKFIVSLLKGDMNAPAGVSDDPVRTFQYSANLCFSADGAKKIEMLFIDPALSCPATSRGQVSIRQGQPYDAEDMMSQMVGACRRVELSKQLGDQCVLAGILVTANGPQKLTGAIVESETALRF